MKIEKQLLSFTELAILDLGIFLMDYVYNITSDESPPKDKQIILNNKLDV